MFSTILYSVDTNFSQNRFSCKIIAFRSKKCARIIQFKLKCHLNLCFYFTSIIRTFLWKKRNKKAINIIGKYNDLILRIIRTYCWIQYNFWFYHVKSQCKLYRSLNTVKADQKKTVLVFRLLQLLFYRSSKTIEVKQYWFSKKIYVEKKN